MIEVHIDSIRVSLMSQLRVVILKDAKTGRYLPIFIGPFEAEAIAVKLQKVDVERPLLPPGELWLTPDAVREHLNRGERVEVAGAGHPRHADASALGDQPAPDLPLTVRNEPPGAALKSFMASYPGRVLVAADSPGRREALLEMLQAADLRPLVLSGFTAFLETPPEPGTPALAVAPLENGFALDQPQVAAFLAERGVNPWAASLADLVAFRDALTASGLKPSSVAVVLSPVCSFFRFASDQGVIGRNPAAGLKRPSASNETKRAGERPAKSGQISAGHIDATHSMTCIS